MNQRGDQAREVMQQAFGQDDAGDLVIVGIALGLAFLVALFDRAGSLLGTFAATQVLLHDLIALADAHVVVATLVAILFLVPAHAGHLDFGLHYTLHGAPLATFDVLPPPRSSPQPGSTCATHQKLPVRRRAAAPERPIERVSHPSRHDA